MVARHAGSRPSWRGRRRAIPDRECVVRFRSHGRAHPACRDQPAPAAAVPRARPEDVARPAGPRASRRALRLSRRRGAPVPLGVAARLAVGRLRPRHARQPVVVRVRDALILPAAAAVRLGRSLLGRFRRGLDARVEYRAARDERVAGLAPVRRLVSVASRIRVDRRRPVPQRPTCHRSRGLELRRVRRHRDDVDSDDGAVVARSAEGRRRTAGAVLGRGDSRARVQRDGGRRTRHWY